jgi:nitrogen fixation protein NifB
MAVNLNNHPCFNVDVKRLFGRVHLPVAPRCNIKCNYCNRKYDCVNESRPGVASAVLSPPQALTYLENVLEAEPRIKVAGIAGPGDPFANAAETMETLHLVRKRYPDIILCLSTNGLNILPYIKQLVELSVSHVTVTVNGVSPQIIKDFYAYVREGRVVYRGINAAEFLLRRQLAAITCLKKQGITVKVNTVVVPGKNDFHIEEIAAAMKNLNVDYLNCLPLLPNENTTFNDIPEPEPQLMDELRKKADQYLPQMRHCTRCRADSVGILGNDDSKQMHKFISLTGC